MSHKEPHGWGCIHHYLTGSYLKTIAPVIQIERKAETHNRVLRKLHLFYCFHSLHCCWIPLGITPCRGATNHQDRDVFVSLLLLSAHAELFRDKAQADISCVDGILTVKRLQYNPGTKTETVKSAWNAVLALEKVKPALFWFSGIPSRSSPETEQLFST